MIGGKTPGASETRLCGGASRRMVTARFVVLLSTIVVLNAPLARGQSGTVDRVAGAGLRMSLDSRWPDGAGYRPVRITVTPTLPVVADRTISVEFTTIFRGARGREDKIRVMQDIELPAGTGGVTATLAVPYMTGHTNYAFQVAENGRWVRGLVGSGSFQSNVTMETVPRVLVVTDQTVTSNNNTVTSHNIGRAFLSPIQLNQGNTGGQYPLPTFQTVDLQELPSRWIDYSALDMILLSIGDLQTLESSQPVVFRALLDWTAAGGNLLVFDVGVEWERRGLLEQLVELSPSESDRSLWRAPDSSRFGKRVAGIGPEGFDPYAEISDEVVEQYQQMGYGRGYGGRTVTVREEKKTAEKKRRPTVPRRAPFASRPYEMGMLVAIATDKPLDEDPGFWAWLGNHLTARRVTWGLRHGISLHEDNPEFFKFLIQGVGKAPLNAFRVLITLFVLGIGPANYYLLQRFRRLHLLVVTVPVSAAAVTMALFAYALFSDGLGTRVRVRSVTQINQVTGQTECWARLSYYSGLAPGGGLQFSDDVAVYPIEAVVGEQTGNRDLIWHKGQKLATGWLRSRTPAQYLTVRSRKSEIGLDVWQPAGGGVSVENRLGTDVELLILRGEGEDLYWTKGLADGASAEARFVPSADAVGDLLKGINACEMVNPPGVDGSTYRNSYRRRSYYGGYNNSLLRPTPMTSLLEGVIQDGGKIVPSSQGGLEPRSYVAIVRFSPEVELGTSKARPEDSLHLVVGSW